MTSLRYAVIGHPIIHSLSPPMQQVAFDALHIPATYERVDVLPTELSSFFDRVRKGEFSGLSITIPHKEAVLPLFDELTERAKTIVLPIRFLERGKIWGDNTDAFGFLTAVSVDIPIFLMCLPQSLELVAQHVRLFCA